jgi:arylsulfatase A-like enzyme
MPRLALIVLACLVSCLRAADSKPNLLIVLSDDHSYPYLGCYGADYLRTPSFDRFAAQGMRFDRCFTAAPQCVPSRAAIMTGRSPVGARITRFSSPLPPDVPSLPDLLRSAGYFTGVCRRNFHLDGSPQYAELYDAHDMRTFKNRVDYFDANSPRDQTKVKVNEFLDKAGAKPWFLWVSFNDPHHAWDADATQPPVDPAKIKLPPHLPDVPGMRKSMAAYLTEIQRADEEFQWILDILETRGLSPNTLVMFMGDNGMAFPHGKGSLYDPGLNVPLLVRWPAVIKPGQSNRHLISGEDLAPTMLQAAGVPIPKQVTGRSFLKLLQGDPGFEPRRHLFAERGPHGSGPYLGAGTKSSTYDLSRAVRTDRHKLIYNFTPHMEYSPVDSAGHDYWKNMAAAHASGTLDPELSRAYFSSPRPIIELYDLQADPSELNNLAGRPETAKVQAELSKALAEYMIVNYDYLPLPPIEGVEPAKKKKSKKN